MRMSAAEKMEIIRMVEQSPIGVKNTLEQLGIHRSTFYSWYDRYVKFGEIGLEATRLKHQCVWNKIPAEIELQIIDFALDNPELSARELAIHYAQSSEYFVSESTVYRLLKKRGLLTAPNYVVLSAADEFKDKTLRVNEMWQTDFTYFKIKGWGWYYLSTVLDDFSRHIVHWELCSTMKAEDAARTVEQALEKAKIKNTAKPKLLSDNGSCYVSGKLKSYLSKRGVKHIHGKPMHPQTQGKIERYHRTMKNRILLEHYYSPEELERALAEFVDYYNNSRLHESLNNLTPADVYFKRGEKILKQREEIKQKTILQRRINHLLQIQNQSLSFV
jgi:putative transposase